MNYRLSQILSTTTLTDDRTDSYDVNISDIISRIVVTLRGTNADSVPDGHPAKGISKMELVDGSNVLFSMTGEEIQATDFYDTGIPPLNVVSYVSANIWTGIFNINFGRWLWDTDWALNPNKFKNLQLKVTHKVGDTAGSSTTNTTSTLTIHAFCFDEKNVSPRGFLLNKEIYAYTIGASGSYEYIDMPTDYPIRRIMAQGLYVGYETHQVVNGIKISEDNDKRILMDESTSYYLKLMAPEYGEYNEALVTALTTGTVAFYTALDYEYRLGFCHTVDSDTAAGATAYPLGGRIYLTAEASQEAVFAISGFAPHGCIPIWCGDQDDPNDWYDARKIGSLVMRLKAGSLGGTATARVVVQQYRTY